jgi:hypothetical protein
MVRGLPYAAFEHLRRHVAMRKSDLIGPRPPPRIRRDNLASPGLVSVSNVFGDYIRAWWNADSPEPLTERKVEQNTPSSGSAISRTELRWGLAG